MTSISSPSVTDELLVIGSLFNSGMVTSLMLGMYTVVYLGTVYIYFNKKRSQNYIVVGAITAMYIITLVQSAVQWSQVKNSVVNKAETRTSAFIASATDQSWQTLLNDFCGLLTSALADGLLIWRCYNVWDGSLHVIAVSLLLLFTETAIYTVTIILLIVNKLNPDKSATTKLNDLISAALFTTASTTGLTASLIAYRIYALSKHDPHNRAKKIFKNVVDVLIQSAAAYAIVSVWYAIEGVIPVTDTNIFVLLSTYDYIFYIFPITAGLASTSMVARVALISSNDATRSGLAHVSGLEFRDRTSNGATTDTIDINPVYLIGGDIESGQKEGGRSKVELGQES